MKIKAMEFKTPVWFCIPRVVTWLIQARDRASDTLSPDVRAGLNYSILVLAACYLEGSLEEIPSGLATWSDSAKVDPKTREVCDRDYYLFRRVKRGAKPSVEFRVLGFDLIE